MFGTLVGLAASSGECGANVPSHSLGPLVNNESFFCRAPCLVLKLAHTSQGDSRRGRFPQLWSPPPGARAYS